jgi:hypothetical protein
MSMTDGRLAAPSFGYLKNDVFIRLVLVAFALLLIFNTCWSFGVGFYQRTSQLTLVIDGSAGILFLVAAASKPSSRYLITLVAILVYGVYHSSIAILGISEQSVSILRSSSVVPQLLLFLVSISCFLENKQVGSIAVLIGCFSLICSFIAQLQFVRGGYASEYCVSIFENTSSGLPTTQIGPTDSNSKIVVVLESRPTVELVLNIPKQSTAVATWKGGQWHVGEFNKFPRQIVLMPAPQGVMVVEFPERTNLGELAKRFLRRFL